MAEKTKMLIKKILAIGESKKQFKNLIDSLREEFKPQGFYENILVDKLAIDHLRLKRLLNYEKEHILKDEKLRNLLYDKSLNQFIMYKKSIEKSIENNIKSLKEFKKEHNTLQV